MMAVVMRPIMRERPGEVKQMARAWNQYAARRLNRRRAAGLKSSRPKTHRVLHAFRPGWGAGRRAEWGLLKAAEGSVSPVLIPDDSTQRKELEHAEGLRQRTLSLIPFDDARLRHLGAGAPPALALRAQGAHG